MISADSISKYYTTDGETVTALNHVSVTIDRGDFVIIMGRSGAGKSTMLGIIGGLLKPSEGNVIIEGQSLWQRDERARAQIRAEKIGFVFQNAPVIRSLTALENVLLPRIFSRSMPAGGSQQDTSWRKRAMSLLEMMGLADRANAYSGALSGGEKRRVAIASALMNRPSVLLADEPTGDLDAETQSLIMDEFKSLSQEGTTILMVTHDPMLMSHASRVLRMDRGTICEVSPGDEMPAIEDFRFTIHNSCEPQTERSEA